MRYYKIEIDGGPTYTSYVNGSTNPGALQVELDIPVAPFNTPMGTAYVEIWGISLDEIGQGKDLINKNVKVYGGFQKGLPLANPAQSGLLVQGFVLQAFGNWIGTSQSLVLMIAAGPAPASGKAADAPKNITMNWKQGQTMGDAIKSALEVAFPGFSTDIKINPKLVLQHDEPGIYENLTQFSQWIRETSKSIITTTGYQGVSITMTQQKIIVYDGSQGGGSQAKKIDFKDLIGQPTWIESPSIQFKCAMRADLSVGDQVQMPPTLVTNSARAQSNLINQKASFQGNFQIAAMRHVGNFRQPDAASWVTVFNAFPMTTQAAT